MIREFSLIRDLRSLITNCSDLSMHGEVFDNVLALFGSPDEQIKTAAAFAAGK